MKSLKVYLIVVTLLLIFSLGVGVFVWFQLQNFSYSDTAQPEVTVESVPREEVDEVVPVGDVEAESGEVSSSPIEEPQTEEAPVGEATETDPEDIEISKDDLTDSQRKALETLGFEADSIVITKEMIVCSENTLGSDRYQEILDGASPGPLEALRLLTCIQ